MAQYDITVRELVSKIKLGEIKIPEMQRQYVWKLTQVRDFLDSLYRRYPSGTILTWETGGGKVATRNFAVDQDTGKNKFDLLLDGQQRLTSLSAIIRGKPIKVHGSSSGTRTIDILFNLEHPKELKIITKANENGGSEEEQLKRDEHMTFAVSNKKLAALPHWVSVTEVFQENDYARFLQDAGVTLYGALYKKYSSRLNQLRAIMDYQYRVNSLGQDKPYEEVTEIFVRVNSLGAKLRSSDLALAQITAIWQDSLKVFQEYEKECQERGFNFDLGLILRNLVAFTTGKSGFQAINGLSKERIQKGWEDSKKGMNYALNFLHSNVCITSPALLSSPLIAIAIAFYGHSKNYKLKQKEITQLRYWVLVANAKGRFSRASTASFLDQDLAAIKHGASVQKLLQQLRTHVGELEILPNDFESHNSKSAYFKNMFLAFRAQNAKDWDDGLVISLKHGGAQHRLQFHHIFPRSLLEKRGLSNSEINDICNLCFISGSTNRQISDKKPSVYLPEVVSKRGEEELTKQCIPTKDRLWDLNEYQNFLAQRRKLIAKRLNGFFGHEEIELDEMS